MAQCSDNLTVSSFTYVHTIDIKKGKSYCYHHVCKALKTEWPSLYSGGLATRRPRLTKKKVRVCCSRCLKLLVPRPVGNYKVSPFLPASMWWQNVLFLLQVRPSDKNWWWWIFDFRSKSWKKTKKKMKKGKRGKCNIIARPKLFWCAYNEPNEAKIVTSANKATKSRDAIVISLFFWSLSCYVREKENESQFWWIVKWNFTGRMKQKIKVTMQNVIRVTRSDDTKLWIGWQRRQGK